MWARRPDVLVRRSAQRLVLKRPDREDVVVLTGSGPLLWELLTLPQPVDALLARLSEHYDVAVEVLAHDVEAALDDLHRRGLLAQVPT